MKFWLVLIVTLLNVSALAQTTDLATGTRAKNNKLIGLTNLSGLKDCGVNNTEGKVRDVRVEEEKAYFDLGKKKAKETVLVDLNRLSESDRKDIFQELVKKGLLLRVSGYTCGTDGIIGAISIDRVY